MRGRERVRLNLLKWIGQMKIRDKIILALMGVSFLLVAGMSGIGLAVYRGILVDNSLAQARGYVGQIAMNLDERVSTFETATFEVARNADVRALYGKATGDDPTQLRARNQNISDAVLQNPVAYRYTRFMFLLSRNGEWYSYRKFGAAYPPADMAETLNRELAAGVDKLHPIRWARVGDEIVFVRLIVDENTFESKGILFSVLMPEFFDFTVDASGTDSLPQESFIVFSDNGDVMHAREYDPADVALQSLVNGTFSGNGAGAAATNVAGAVAANGARGTTIQYRGERTLVTEVTTRPAEWRVIHLVKARDLYRKDRIVLALTALLAVGALAVSLLLTLMISRGLMRTIVQIQDGMTEAEAGNFKARIKPASYDEVGMLGLRFNYMITRIEKLIDTVARERTAKQEAEFKALQAQVNPHFLYNSLGSVKWMARRDGQTEIEGMIDAIIELMRGSISAGNSFQTVADEMRYVGSYLSLQRMRYGDAFVSRFEVEPEIEGEEILGFLLQPLVENALYHGIDTAENSGEIEIRGFRRDGALVLQVIDNGVGVDEERISRILAEPRPDETYTAYGSIGIRIVAERLRAHYGKAARFSLENRTDGRGTVAEIVLPGGGLSGIEVIA